MTRKRIRYSELAAPTPSAPAATPAAEAVAPELPSPEPVAATPVDSQTSGPVPHDAAGVDALIVERDEGAPLISVGEDRSPFVERSAALSDVALPPAAAPAERIEVQREVSTPTRPRRNSTPVELARTLTAERRAARAQEGAVVDDAHDWDAPTIDAGDEPQRTLRERTRSRSGTAELLMFRVGGERFAVELIVVDEVIDLPVIHHVPEMPPAMLGVVTVRGSLTPVYSPQHALGLELSVREALLIFRRGAQRVGILIDDVDDALTADMSELAEKPGGDEGTAVLLGVIRLANTLVGIIDADALITSCQSANILEPA